MENSKIKTVRRTEEHKRSEDATLNVEKKLLKLFLINLLPLLVLIMPVTEILDATSHTKGYPFGSDFFSPDSIYKSEQRFLTYQILFISVLLSLILSSFFQKKTVYYILLVLAILFFFYPMLTNG